MGSDLLEKTTRKGRKFYGYERFPTGGFTHGTKVMRRNARSAKLHGRHIGFDLWLLCSNETCRHHEQMEEAEEAEHA